MKLRGVTWAHDRGLAPMLASIPDYAHVDPTLQISWDARSLLDFGEVPIEELAARYDLLVIDHPFIAQAAESGAILPLDGLLETDTLAALAAESIGPSHASYRYREQQWALAVDAAAQVSAHRPDLLERLQLHPPSRWDELEGFAAALADGGSALAMPLIPTDLVPAFYTIATNFGYPLFDGGNVIATDHGQEVLRLLRAIAAIAHPLSHHANPIQILDRMAEDSTEIAYVPLLFGYSNYSRAGYAAHRIAFGGMPSARDLPVGSTLGGAGIAISRRCRAPEKAAAYAAWLAGGEVQAGVYVRAGGQPAHVRAWHDPAVDALAGGFFSATEPTLVGAYVRPRVVGYLGFQTPAGELLREHIDGSVGDHDTLAGLDRLWTGITPR